MKNVQKIGGDAALGHPAALVVGMILLFFLVIEVISMQYNRLSDPLQYGHLS